MALEQTRRTRRWRNRDRFLVAIPIVFVLSWISLGFRKSIDVAWNESRTQGVITGRASHGSYRYQYSVDSETYSGVGMPETNPDSPTPPTLGSEVTVRYSRKHPWNSGLSDPLLFPKQIGCLVAILAGFALIICLTRRRRRQTIPESPRPANSGSCCSPVSARRTPR